MNMKNLYTLGIVNNTQLFISKTIAKTSNKTCRKITISEKMECIIDKIGEQLLSNGITCLPFYYHNVFTKLHSEFSQCKEDTVLTEDKGFDTLEVRNIPINM